MFINFTQGCKIFIFFFKQLNDFLMILIENNLMTTLNTFFLYRFLKHWYCRLKKSYPNEDVFFLVIKITTLVLSKRPLKAGDRVYFWCDSVICFPVYMVNLISVFFVL